MHHARGRIGHLAVPACRRRRYGSGPTAHWRTACGNLHPSAKRSGQGEPRSGHFSKRSSLTFAGVAATSNCLKAKGFKCARPGKSRQFIQPSCAKTIVSCEDGDRNQARGGRSRHRPRLRGNWVSARDTLHLVQWRLHHKRRTSPRVAGVVPARRHRLEFPRVVPPRLTGSQRRPRGWNFKAGSLRPFDVRRHGRHHLAVSPRGRRWLPVKR